MKILRPLFLILALSLSIASKANEIDSASNEIAQTISPKILLELDLRIEEVKEKLNLRIRNLEQIDSITEGKIVASMIDMVETDILSAERKLAIISGDQDLNQENINTITKLLDQAEKIISEI